jgi:hypothetical protein
MAPQWKYVDWLGLAEYNNNCPQKKRNLFIHLLLSVLQLK